MKIENMARGQSCYLRIPGCSHDPEKTVLCHIRRGGIGGTAIKPPSICALPLDDYCHSVVDGRIDIGMSRDEIDANLLRGLVQWLAWLDRNGKIKVI